MVSILLKFKLLLKTYSHFRNECHDTCPICREKLESTDDTWVISEVPKAEEISKEIRENLIELTEDRPSLCHTS